jgi:hypothetical protein
MQGNRSNIVAENAFLTPVIPSEEDRSLVNDLHGRGTCFSRSRQDAALRETAGLSTPLEMTEYGVLHGTTRVVPSPSGATANA